MNIIFIVNFQIYKDKTGTSTIGGIETNTKDVINELRNRGHRVWHTEKQPIEPEWVKGENIDVIATSTFDPLTYLKVIKFKKRFPGSAVVIHGHTSVEDLKSQVLPDIPFFNLILKTWLRIMYAACDLLITPSSYSKKCIEQMQSSMTYPIHPVSNGICIEKFAKKPSFRPNFRTFLYEQYNIPPDAKIILNVGLTWKRKGVDTFGKIAAALPDYWFVWVGPINKNPDIEIVRKLENVIFTGFYDDIREPYYGADVFLNTSYAENQGIPLIEAAICRVPLVTSDLPAYDWIDHKTHCYKADSVEEYVSGIQKIIDDDQFRETLVQNAYKKAIEVHDFKKIGEKVERLYRKAQKIKEIKDQKHA
ncbi:MAG: glycosyltransferase family 4 protein [Promethearchaeia archaeon]